MEAILIIRNFNQLIRIKFCPIIVHVSPHCIKFRNGIEKRNRESTLQYSRRNRFESTISIKRNSSCRTISNHRGDFSSRIVYEIHRRTIRSAVCQNFFNRAAFSFKQRPDKVGEAFVIPAIFRGIPDNEGSRPSRTKIFQNLSTTRKIVSSRPPR